MGAIGGGVSDAVTQLGTNGHVDWGGVAMSAGIGAVFGAAGGRGGRAGPTLRRHHRPVAATPSADEPAAPPARVGGGPDKPIWCHSFAPTTRVLMADGTTKPIGEINIGDKVKATDPTTGKTEAKPVTALHLNRDKELTTVTRCEQAASPVPPRTDTLETTQNHPYLG